MPEFTHTYISDDTTAPENIIASATTNMSIVGYREYSKKIDNELNLKIYLDNMGRIFGDAGKALQEFVDESTIGDGAAKAINDNINICREFMNEYQFLHTQVLDIRLEESHKRLDNISKKVIKFVETTWLNYIKIFSDTDYDNTTLPDNRNFFTEIDTEIASYNISAMIIEWNIL